MGSQEAGVADHEDEPAPRTKNPPDCPQRRVKIGDVHQSELARHPVNGTVGDRIETLRVVDPVLDAERDFFLVRVGDRQQFRCRIHADHRARSSIGECSTRHALTARNIEHRLAIYLGHQLERGRRCQFMRSATHGQERVRYHDAMLAQVTGASSVDIPTDCPLRSGYVRRERVCDLLRDDAVMKRSTAMSRLGDVADGLDRAA